MGGGRGRLGHRPSPPPTQGLRDCECQQPRQPRAQKTGTWALAGGEGGQDASMGLPKASLTQREASCGEQKDKHTRAPLKHLPCLGPFHRRFCLRLTRGGGRGQVRTSPWRGGLLRIFPRPVSLLPGWGPLLLLRDKEGARAQLGQESRKKGCPSPLRKNSGWSLTTFESCPEGFTPFST